MSSLSVEDVQNAREFVSFSFGEVCGSLRREGGDSLVLYVEAYGEEGYRKTCRLGRFSRHIWHTHPYNSKGYPSSEDVIQVVKKHTKVIHDNDPVSSVVFTRWGIWEISSVNKLPINFEDRTYRFLEYNLSRVGHILYFASNKGRATQPPLDMIERYISNVKKITEKVGINLKIAFTEWNLESPYVLRFDSGA